MNVEERVWSRFFETIEEDEEVPEQLVERFRELGSTGITRANVKSAIEDVVGDDEDQDG